MSISIKDSKKTMDFTFAELKCPCCGSSLKQGSAEVGHDVRLVKRCADPDCKFWMIIVIPNSEYDYTIKASPKNYFKKDGHEAKKAD